MRKGNVLIGDGIHDRVSVQLLAEGLLDGLELRVAAAARVDCEDRHASEPEEVETLEGLRDRRVHVAKLRAVALIEDDDDVAAKDGVALVGGDESRKLLDGRDDDARVRVFELLLQHRR